MFKSIIRKDYAPIVANSISPLPYSFTLEILLLVHKKIELIWVFWVSQLWLSAAPLKHW